MQKEDLGYSFAIGLVVGLFLLPILVNTDLYSKLPAPIILAILFAGLPIIFTGIVFLVFSFSKKPEMTPQSVSTNQPEAEDEAGGQVAALGTKNVIPQGESVKVTRVVDGDTIKIEGGQTVRYIGIDTPETVHPQKTVECFGREASNKNKELVEGKFVQLEKDVSEVDKYGRLLRYAYVDPSTSSGQAIFVNELLVKEGFAHASSYPPDVKYQDLLNSVQKDAQSQNTGLRAGCSDNSASSQASPDGCQIKGNISFSTGEKIYHMQGQEYYDKTVIDESKGERWFCTENEAQDAGWRKSKK